jgi:hypothetical protein
MPQCSSKVLQLMRNASARGRRRSAVWIRWIRKEASVAAGGVSERRGLGWLLLRPIGTEEIKDAANRPIAQRNPENESNDDNKEQKERKKKRHHIHIIK